jgi:hypothetical protein
MTGRRKDWLFKEVRTETKAEARDRARAIVRCLGLITDLPEFLETVEYYAALAELWIEKGQAGKLTLDDWDGIVRNISEVDYEVTERDERAMQRDASYWTPSPTGWIGYKEGELFRSKLHPKELKMLRWILSDLDEQRIAAPKAAAAAEKQLRRLRKIGALPEDIANRHALTEGGYYKPPVSPPIKPKPRAQNQQRPASAQQSFL